MPPSKTRLPATLVDAPILLFDPPLARAETDKVPPESVVTPVYVLLPESVQEPVPAFMILSTVGPASTPELEIRPPKEPVPWSCPVDRLSAFPPPPAEKSIVPLPVMVPALMVAPAAP